MQLRTAQLRVSYPAACLLSELLTVQQTAQQTTYVVRALVQIGGTTIATGLAAAPDIEAAEDRAKLRVLDMLMPPTAEPSLDVVSASTIHSPEIQPSSQTLEQPEVDVHNESAIAPSTAPLPASLAAVPLTVEEPLYSVENSIEIEQAIETPLVPEPTPSVGLDWDAPLPLSSTTPLEPDFDLTSLLQPPTEIEESLASENLFEQPESLPDPMFEQPESLPDPISSIPAPEPTPSKAGKPPKRKAADLTSSLAPMPGAEIDRSEEIARIGVEMKRLGWDTKQGREHLQRTYGKRSRQELNDDELMDFLQYLERQPSTSQTPF